MKYKIVLAFTILLFDLVLFAQNLPKSSYWVKLKDKTGTPYQISRPENFLSLRAINRRVKQNIPIEETDLPVSPVYLDSLKKRGLEIVHASKWLNGATVRTADTALIGKVSTLPFVTSVQLTKPASATKSTFLKFREEELLADINPANYGNAINQLTQLKGDYLHNKGFRGKGIQIAILDAGFWHVNQIAAFDSLRKSNRILGTRDFVDPSSDIYQQHTHGMSVLSCIGGNQPLSLIGTAPDAAFYLFRTEDSASEYPIEEDNWVVAAELADSVGADVINSSLGYTVFDDPKMSHKDSELNGKTTRITQGANMAFRKGILVFNSAGNEGKSTWKRVNAPADGENVIAVAAVDKNGIRASFSSVGPAYGGAVKPNVAAMGSLTFLVGSTGVLDYLNGTSFSSPVLAGMGACLLQANPNASVKQIKMAIEQSGSIFNKPDSLLGYGIPDFEKADKYLKLNTNNSLYPKSLITVSPNPFSDFISIKNLDTISGDYYLITIYNLRGVCLLQSYFKYSETILLDNLSYLPNGFLILSIRSGGKDQRFKMIKTSNYSKK